MDEQQIEEAEQWLEAAFRLGSSPNRVNLGQSVYLVQQFGQTIFVELRRLRRG